MAVAFDKTVGTAIDTAGTNETVSIPVSAGGVAVGDAIVVTASWIDSSRTLSSVTDPAGNTYRVDVASGPRTGSTDWVGVAVGYVASGLSAGGTIVLHWSGTGGVGPSIACRADAFSGWSSIPVLDPSGGTHTNPQSASNAPTTGALTTGNANDLLIEALCSGGAGGNSVTGDAAFTTIGTVSAGANLAFALTGYKLVSSTAAYTATGADATTTKNWFNAIVAYQQPAAAAAPAAPIPIVNMAPYTPA